MDGHADAVRPGGERIVFAWHALQVGVFDCWPGDDRWRMENRVEEGHVIAFPGTAVEITHEGQPARVAEPNRILLYNRHQAYRRRLVDSAGDHCTYLVVSPELLEALSADGRAEITDPERRPFRRSVQHVRLPDHLEEQTLVQMALTGEQARTLELQERLIALVARLLAGPSGHRGQGDVRSGRSRTTLRHQRLVEDARAVLAADPARSLRLDDIAAAVGTSVFHLCRVFRRHTGMALHAYRDELRLRSALPSVLEGSRSLTEIALDAGYASPSHFTDRFRALYGVPPSALRSPAGRSHPIPSKITEAH